jgi:signal peptidase II
VTTTPRKWGVFALVVVIAVALDFGAKHWAVANLPLGSTVKPYGAWLPLTLGYNRGIAFGLHAGDASRVLFTVVSILVLPVVFILYRSNGPREPVRGVALALMFAGALGNLVDRVASARGVVDFIGPYNLGFMLWPVFNLADVWVVVGTLTFALIVGRRTPAGAIPGGSGANS